MKLLRRLVALSAWLYVGWLLFAILAMRYVGERWWMTGVALYAPRLVFAVPLPIVVLALAAVGPRRLLWTQLGAAILLAFPLMGLVIPRPTPRAKGAPVVRILSYNVDSIVNGIDGVLGEIDRFSPDIVVLQEIGSPELLQARMRDRYPIVDMRNQFLLATRFKISSTIDPEKVESGGRLRSPRFVQQVLDTPLGPIALYNVHPISPREVFYGLRGTATRSDFLRRGILHDLVSPGSNALFEGNAGLRAMQVHTFSEMASKETLPVLIAGDTNLPGLSYILYRDLSRFHDAFDQAGGGLGYTFPNTNRSPWMRIDRVLAGEGLRFVGFQVGSSLASDHRCIVVDVQKDER
ncbi:MAG TPA: endonuclease/exonuclease/phosphatase family protein [Polyangiaceae bacterium]|jgi:endonuclease/exonuclease/phosphatase (EEP) superfamily protein YafD